MGKYKSSNIQLNNTKVSITKRSSNANGIIILWYIYKAFIKTKIKIQKWKKWRINPLTSPGERVTVFTSPYLSAGAPALGEVKGLIT